MVKPSVAAIICTRNRSRRLQRCLEAMRGLELDGTDFELIVVDNGSADPTSEVINAFKASAPFPVRHLFEPKTGLSRARNCGLRQTDADIILFTDDDCYVGPDWVAATVSVFGSDTRRLVAGRVELFDKTQLPITVKTATERDELHSLDKMIGFVFGANMAIGRRVLTEIGWFDIRLGAGTTMRAAEDTDFAYRAFRAGIPISYEPAIVVAHDHGRKTRTEGNALMRGYQLGKGAVAAKYLLKADPDFLRVLLWELASKLRAYRAGRCQIGEILTTLATLPGMISFLLLESWKRLI
jgi:glycosyltransferase involved in cell wall biosynthesis